MAKGNSKQATQVSKAQQQTFQVAAPEASNVLLVGDFTRWQERGIRMEKGRDGVWTTAVELSPGKHRYRFIVDGEWRDDPECTRREPNPYGGEDMVREAA